MAQAAKVIIFKGESRGDGLGVKKANNSVYLTRTGKDNLAIETYGRLPKNQHSFHLKSLEPDKLPDVPKGQKLVVHPVTRRAYYVIEIPNGELAAAMKIFDSEKPRQEDLSGGN